MKQKRANSTNRRASDATGRAGQPTAATSPGELVRAAVAHHQAGRLTQAADIYRQVLAVAPGQADALHLLGVIEHQQGNSASALELIGKAIALEPTAPMHFNRGLALRSLGDLSGAAHSYRQALSTKPDYAEAHYSLGVVLQEMGETDAAAESYRRAIACRPVYPLALNNLGNIQQQQRLWDAADESYRRAIAGDPGFAEAHNNLANLQKAQGRLEQAIASYRQAILVKPDYADAHSNLGAAYHAQGLADQAAACYRQAIKLDPAYLGAYNNLGALLKEQGVLDAAVACYEKALQLKPDFAEAHGNLANALLAQGRLDAAVESYRKALALKPDYVEAHSNLLFALSYHAESTPVQLRREAEQYGRNALAQAAPFTDWPRLVREGEGPAASPLRVGLVSGDLRNHPVGYFLESIVARLSPSRIELIAYPTSYREDALSARIKPCFKVWRPLAGLSDEAAAKAIRDDGVHVLIDLAGHTAHNRLPVFAWKPAPVQVSWLGYFATTGVPGMDYLLADRVSVPESDRAHFTEAIWSVPDTRLCFTPPDNGEKVSPGPLPAMRNGYITFACFQSLSKLNDDVLAVWGRIFRALPQARLRLQNKQLTNSDAREHLKRRLERVGIGAERVVVAGPAPRAEYLASHAEVDILLDTFPYPGGTTTCEALWMGVPTLTLLGNTMLSRQGASLLACVGLNDWIAEDREDYVAKALAHAADIEGLAELRSVLRRNALASPLFDAARFALNLEEAFEAMWQRFTEQGAADEGCIDALEAANPEVVEECATASADRPDASEALLGHLREAIEHHQAGRLGEAEAVYRLILKSDARQPDALHLLGALAHQTGQHAAAVQLIGQAIALHPTCGMHHNLGLALQALGEYSAARACYRNALVLKPDYVDAYANMGIACQLQGLLPEAVECYEKALSLAPENAQVHNNLANVLKVQGAHDAAIAHYRAALALRPDYPDALNNLGNALQAVGQPEEAVASYRAALAFKGDCADFHNNLGLALLASADLDAATGSFRAALAIAPQHVEALSNIGLVARLRGDWEAAIESFKQALLIKPDSTGALNGLGAALIMQGEYVQALQVCVHSLNIAESGETKALIAQSLEKLRFGADNQEARRLLVRAIAEPWGRPGDLLNVSISLIKSRAEMRDSLQGAMRVWTSRPGARETMAPSCLAPLIEDELLQCLLENTTVGDLALERMLTLARKSLLEAVCGANGEMDRLAADLGSPQAGILTFSCALARQCFINEYVYACTEGEFELASQLKERLGAALSAGAPFPPEWLASAGAYFPLANLPSIDKACAYPWPDAVSSLLKLQVVEPREERKIAQSISRLTGIEDAVSRLVQAQYEEHPYPRWIQPAPVGNASTVDMLLRQYFPFAAFYPLGKADAVDILIAGCGTGQHPIETARQVRGARVRAIDLSLASLSYAKRKAGELGVSNLEFAQADIMKLSAPSPEFDVIESVGVLHHLADPLAGWRQLLTLLRPRGFMRLGFYSDLGRQDVVAGRQFIAEHGYASTDEGIRRCRQDLMSEGNIARFSSLVTSRDFFGTSECRDLLFHVQEHRYTLPGLKAMLGELGLNFLGFYLDPITLEKYRVRFPADPAMTDLDSWHVFETENPHTFAGMYQFWVQRQS